jgi:hypothetical protein
VERASTAAPAGAAPPVPGLVRPTRNRVPAPSASAARPSTRPRSRCPRVIIDDGFRGNDITWVVVRNWPAQSTLSERLNDTRFDELRYPRTVLLPDGKRVPLSPHVYFFDGPELTMFPVKMTENDITELHGHFRGMTDYRQMLPLLRRFELRDE